MSGRRGRSRPGAAMVEFVLALPFLAVLIALIFFLGWAVSHQRDVIVSARYASWQDALGGPDVGAGDLDSIFFAGGASGVSVGDDDGPDGTRKQLQGEAGRISVWAEALAREALFGADPLPGGSGATVAASFPTSVALWRRFEGAISKRHVRDGLPWRRGQGSPNEAIRRQFLADLDQRLTDVPPQAAKLAEKIRNLYRKEW